jgi:hypothetical protein
MTLKQYDQRVKQEMAHQTKIGQVATLSQEKDGRVVADARTTSQTSSSPHGKPVGKLVPVKTASQLTVGQHVRLTDQQVHGLAEVVRVYPASYKSLDTTEASCYLEGLTNHAWSGLYFDEHLKQYQAVIVQGS